MSTPRELVIVKLGGSLITDKRQETCARPEVITRLAEEIAEALPGLETGLVIGHGSGSFGHVAARRHGLGRGPFSPADPVAGRCGVGITQDQAARLHRMVVEALLDHGVPAFGWAPSSALVSRRGTPVRGTIEPLWQALESHLVPVIYGDVMTDLEWGMTICSTETAVRYLISRWIRRSVGVRRVLWCGETEGLYDRRGDTLETIRPGEFRHALDQITDTAGTDVTGGMRLRLETARALARQGVESLLLDGRIPGRLAQALAGQPVPGTRIIAEPVMVSSISDQNLRGADNSADGKANKNADKNLD